MSNLKSCCKFQEGYVNPPQSIPEYFDGNIKWLRSLDLNNSFVYNTSRTLTKEGFESAGKSAYMFPKDSIAISKSGTIGELGILKDRMCGNRAVINIEVDKDKADLMYIFYLLKFKKSEIISKSVGSIQKNLYISALETLDLCHDDIKDQQKISSILSCIDNKIENNKKIIKLLNKTLNTIYNYWFNQYGYPGSLSDNFPDNWKETNFKETKLFSIIKPGVDKFHKKIYLPTANVIGTKIVDGNFISYDNRENRANMQPVYNSIWVAKMKNSIKNINITENDKWLVDNYIFSTGFLGFKCDSILFPYLYCVVNNVNFENMKDKLSHGATQEGINNNDLKYIPFVEPSMDVLEKFSNVALPIIKNINGLILENRNLSEMGNWLLPHLMKDYLKVGD